MPPRLVYYLSNIARLSTPRGLILQSRAEIEREIERLGRAELEQRLAAICRFPQRFPLPSAASQPGWELLRSQRNYAFDLLEHTRALPRQFRYCWRFGDDYSPPEIPTLVKARGVDDASGHAVVFPLNKVRHYFRVPDSLSFREKRDSAIWRGKALRPWRQQFLRENFHKRGVDAGCVDDRPENAPYRRPFASFAEQLSHKFVISIEGNDVATNLKWIMASQSLCLMVPPKVESWFLEGQLIPDVHYVALRPDYADLEDQIERYSRDVSAAERILAAAQARAAPFFDRVRERVLARAVLWRYAQASGQSEA